MVRGRFLTVLIFLVSLLVSSCVHRTAPQPTELSNRKALLFGYRPLPREFMGWWFDNLERIKKGEIQPVAFLGASDSKAIVHSSWIAATQIVLTQPEVGVLPSSYVTFHTPPKDQGYNGTCWAFATVGSLESALLTQLSRHERLSAYPFLNPENPDLSEQFVAYYNVNFYTEERPEGSWKLTCQETNEDIGGEFEFFSMFNLIRRGVPPEDVFPYILEEQVWIKWNALDDTWKTRLVRSQRTVIIQPYDQFKESGGSHQTYIRTIKSALMKYGALGVSFEVYEDFRDYWLHGGRYVYRATSDEILGGHAVLLVGWVDDFYDPLSGYRGPIWVLKNSCGTGGGFSLYDYGLSSSQVKGYFALPMITEEEYRDGNCPSWKIEHFYMAVPLLKQ